MTMMSNLTPANFVTQINRLIITHDDDPQLAHQVMVSLMEDTLAEFGYEKGVAIIRSWRKAHEA